tara:strand:+ start:124 stop:945 length:822 start_codon:yes stop_codon:yes gene_type:complete
MCEQHAREFETAVLEQVCSRDEVVPAARNVADIVDSAWARETARYTTEKDIQAYAENMLALAQTFFDEVHGGARITVCLQKAQEPACQVFCRIKMCDKLQEAMDVYNASFKSLGSTAMEYDGLRLTDNRVYAYNTPGALNMKDYDVIRVWDNAYYWGMEYADQGNTKSDMCIKGAEGLLDVTSERYVWEQGELFGTYAMDFCERKGLDPTSVCFFHGGMQVSADHWNVYQQYPRKDFHFCGEVIIHVLPKPDCESDVERCFLSCMLGDEIPQQ